ncbi:hypothetical protein BGZ73_004180 [Actinomortierella ambigua]|nr:hypothetical protein BGZ73_004180 [Actinomortierella ambigua]
MPSINPVLILNAAAALSNFNSGLTGTTAGHADITADHHPGSIPNPLAQPVYAANGYGHTGRPAMPLTSLAAKDDVRRRANTEPSKYKLLNGARGQLKILRGGQTAEASDVGNVSNISEAPFRLTSPPGRRRKPVLGTEYLDSASEALLARTSARSSMAPLYSGYIWLYIPNANDESFSSSNSNTSSRSPSPAAGDTEYKTNSTWTSRHQSTEELFESRDSTAHNDEDSIVASTGAASMSSSRPSPSTTPPPSNNVTNGSGSGTPRAANISMSKATGRYVKCFAAINEHGQLQWVEVKKQSELATSNKTATGVSSRASYGIPLRSDNNDSNSPLSFQRQKSSTESAESNKSSGGNSETSSSTSSSKDKQRMVQVCMAQKLRLFFFCIVISPASMSRLTMERTTTTSTNVVIQSPLRNIVEASELQTPNKPRQRLSATLSAAAPAAEADVAGSKTPNNALPPLPLQFMRSMPPGDGSVTTDSKAQPSIKKSASLPTGEAQTFDSHGAALSHEPSLQRAQSQTRIDTTARNQSALTASGEGNPSEAVTAEPQIGSQKSLKRCPPTRPRPETPPPLATKAAAAAANARAAEESKQGLSHPNSATSSQSPRLVLSSPVSLPTFSSSVFGSPVQGSSMSIAGVSMMPASPDSCRASSPDGALSNVTGSPVSPVMARAQSLQKAFRMMQQQQQQQEPTPAASPNSEKPNEVTVVSPSLEDSSGPSAHHVSPSETPMSASEDTTIHAKSTSENQCLMTTQGAPAKATRALASEESSHLTYESCPFLEFNPPGSMSSIEILGGDEKDGGYLTLRGYTETEEEWKALQVALERFVLGPTKDLKYALPPMDTLIPSYHSPPLPEVRLSEKAQSFLNAKPVPSSGTPGQQLNTRRLHSPSSTSLAVSGSTFAGAMEYPTGTHPPPTLPPPQAPAPAPAPTPPTSQNHYHSQTPLTVTATIYPLNDLTDLEANSQGQHFHLSPHVSSREQFSPPSVHEKDTFPSSERSTNHSNHQYYHNSHPMLQGNPASSRSRSRDHLSLSMGASSLHQGAKIRPRLNAQRSADELGKHSHIVRSPGPSSVGGSSPLFSVNGAESSLQAGAGFGFTMPHTSTTITHTTATPAAASPVKKREQRLSGTGLGLWIGSHAAEMIGLKSSKKHQQQLAQQLQPSAKDIVVKVDTAVMPSGQQQRLLNSDARSIPILASSVGTTADSQTKRTAPSLLKKSESSSSTTTVHTTSSRMTQDVGSSGSGDNITGVRAGMSPSYKDDHSSRDIPLGFSQVQGEAESATEPAYISQATAGREMTCASSPISVNTESVHVAMVSSLKAESGPSWYHHSHPQNTYDGQQQSSDQVYGSARSRTTTAEGGLMIQHPPTAKSDVHSTHLKKNGSAPPPRDPGDMYCPPPSQPHGRQVNNNDVGHRPNGASPLLKGHSSFSGAIQTVVASTGGDGTGEDTWIPDRERNGSSKRQNTVVGASKAAVSGVLGMFRKSVG